MSLGAGDRPHDGVRDLVFNVRVGGRARRGRRTNGLATEAVIVDSLLVHRSVENHVDAA